MSEWARRHLGDLLDIKHGYAFEGQYFSDVGRHRLITPGNFAEKGGFADRGDKQKRYNGPVPKDYVLEPGALIVAMTEQAEGLLGSSAIVPSGDPCLHNQRIGLVCLRREDAADKRFLYYLFNTKVVRDQIRASASGVKVRHTSPGRIKAVSVCIPVKATQERIASILSAYDGLIEVNRRRVAILEEMARRLFEEWFVHLRFPGHETVPVHDTPDGPLPKGWVYAPLVNIAEVTYGFAFKSKVFNAVGDGLPVIRIRNVLDGFSDTFSPEKCSDRFLVADGDLLIGMDGIFHTRIWSGGRALLNQRVARLRSTKDHSAVWLYQSLIPKIKHLEATISGTTVAHLSARDMNKLSVLTAENTVQKLADGFLNALGQQIVCLEQAGRKLAAARDLLLPRLISGELSAADVALPERFLEAAD